VVGDLPDRRIRNAGHGQHDLVAAQVISVLVIACL